MKTRKQFMAFVLTLVVAVTALLPNGLVFAADVDINTAANETDGFYYTLDYMLSEDKTEETMTLILQAKEDVVIQEVILPDGEVFVYTEQPVTYTVVENGVGNFTVKYIKGKSTKPVEKQTTTEAVSEEITETETGTETSHFVVQEAVIPFEITDISQIETPKSESEKEENADFETFDLNSSRDTVVTTFSQLKDAITNANDGDTININGTIMVTETLSVTKSITLSGGTLKRDSGFSSGQLIQLNSNRNITMEVSFADITLDGDNISCSGPSSLIAFLSGSDIIHLKSGAKLINNISVGGGGAITDKAGITAVRFPNTVIIEDGALIANNENMGGIGGAIGPYGGITIQMYGGVVENNRGVYGSAFAVNSSGDNKILGGKITNNIGTLYSESTSDGADLGAVYVSDSASLTLGGNVIISNNFNMKGVESNLRVESLTDSSISLEKNVTGKIGISVDDVSKFNIKGIFNNGYEPNLTMPQNSLGSNAIFFSDDSNYITRLEKNNDGSNKIILGLPKITYHLRGGDFTDATEKTFYTAANQPIAKPYDPTFTDHAFVNWYSTVDTSDAGTVFDFSTPIEKDTDIYARWYPDVYSISFDANSGSGSMDDIEHNGGTNAVDLPANTFTRTGYTFTSWNTAPDGTGTAVADQATDFAPGNTNTTLYAQWKPITYTVTYNSMGGSAVSPETDVVGNTAVKAPADPTLLGHGFEGWYTDDQFTDKWDFSTLITTDTTLFAKWNPIVYRAHFDANSGTGSMNDMNFIINDTLTLTANAFTNAGYTFTGWNTEAGGSGTAYADMESFPSMLPESMTLYAQWEAKEYVVKYDTQSADAIPNKTGVHFTDKNLLPADPVKAGYTFAGWKLDDTDITADTTYNSLVAEDTVMDVTLVAQWTANSYTVQYNTKGGNLISDKTGIIFTDSGLLPVDPIKAGYTFHGWKLDDTDVAADTTYDSLVADDTVMQITLEAQWVVNEYSVKYDTKGAGIIADKASVKYADANLLPTDTLTKDGHIFLGWKYGDITVSDTDTYESLAKDDTVKSITLVAQWEIKKFTVTWKTKDGEPAGSIQGGTQTESDITYKNKPEKEITVELASDKEEYTLVGWNYEYIPDGHTEKVTGFTDDYKSLEILGDTTFTAKFASTPFVQAAAVNGKITVVKGNTASEITSSTTNTAQVKFTKEDDIDAKPGSAAIKIAADIHHHLDKILLKDYLGHEYTFQASDTITGEYEVGGRSPLTKVEVNFDKSTGILLLSNIDTSLYVEATFVEDTKYKVEFFTEKDDSGSLVQTNGELYTGNPVGAKPGANPVKIGYTFGGWSLDGTDAPDQMYDSQKLITDADIAYYAVWIAKEYQVSYDLDGGTAKPEPADKTVEFFEAGLLPLDTEYAKIGYTFDGWSDGIQKVSNTTTYETLALDDTTMEITLKAQWKPIGYQVMFDKQAKKASGTMSPQDYLYDEEQALHGNGFTYPGYTFAGWADTEEGDVVYTDGQAMKNLTEKDGEQVTLYAVWNANGNTKYTTEHYKQQADGTWGTTPDETENLTGKTDTTANAVPKEYVGFVYDKEIAETVESGTIAGDGKLVLKLYYRAERTTSFDSNGGNYTPLDQTVNQGDTLIKPTDPTRDGYDFGGWYYTDADGKEQKWDFKDPVNKDIELTAKWIAHTYEIEFQKNSTKAKGTMENQPFAYDEEKALSANAFTRSGYTFLGWAEEADGTVVYTNSQNVLNLTDKDGKKIVLYAVWAAKGNTKYTVEHYKQKADGTWGSIADETENLTGKTDTIVSAVPKTYAGFLSDLSILGTVSSGMISGDETLLLKIFYRAQHQLSFDSNGGDYTPDDQTVVYGEQAAEPKEPIKEGSDFEGWHYTDADGKEQKWNFGDPVTSTLELTAKWKLHTYNVAFDKNNDAVEGTMENQVYSYGEKKSLTQNGYTYAGYTFAGWAGEKDGAILYADMQEVMDLTKVKDDTVTLYAVWNASGDTKYTVEHYKQQTDGTWRTTSDETDNLTGKTDTTVNAVPKEYAGFVYDKEITGTVETGMITGDGKLTLKLYYHAERTTSFDSNGGNYTPSDQTVNHGNPLTKPTNPTKDGYHFDGWYYTDADGKEQKWDFKDPISKDMELKAKWIAHTYEIEFQKNSTDAKGTMENQPFVYDEEQALSTNAFSRDGYTFLGWAGEADGAILYTDGQKALNLTNQKDVTITLYAVWAAKGDTRYTVEHYKQKADGTWGTTPDESETLTGKTDTTATAVPKEYAGFYFDPALEGNDVSGTITGDHKLVLKLYYRAEHQVSFDSNGGDYTPEGQMITQGGKVTEPKAPGKEGSDFEGWYYSDADGKEQKWNFDDSVTSSLQLTAKWKLQTYTVVFNKNNDTAEGTMEDQRYSYGEKKALTENSYTYSGYTFAGWAVEKDGKVVYANQQEVADLTKEKDGTVTLYAIWNATGDTKYSIEYYKQKADGTWGGTPDETDQLTGKTDTAVNATPKTYEGYAFDSEIKGTVISGIIAGDGSLVLKAYYRMQVTVSFDSDGGNHTPGNQKLNLGDKAVKPNTPSRSGYTFEGWYYGNTKWDFTEEVTTDMVLKAHWTKIEQNRPVTPINPNRPAPPTRPTYTTKTVKTGDTTNLMLYGLMAGFSGLFVLGMVYGKRGKRKEEEQ